MMRRMDGSVVWRAALLQALTLTVVALVLGALLDREFFRVVGLARRARAPGRRVRCSPAPCCKLPPGRCSPAPRWPGCRAWSACWSA